MQKIGDQICKHKTMILVLSFVLLFLSIIGTKLTKINYDILVYLPEDIETIKGQTILTQDFNMGAYTVLITNHLKAKDILSLEEKIKNIEGVNQVISAYDIAGTTIPLDMLPNEIIAKIHKENTDLLFVTFQGSTSSEKTIKAVEKIKEIANDSCKVSGMSAMVLDTMNLSEKEIAVYIVIAVILCMVVLTLALDSYLVPILLLLNIGIAILFNLGSNILFGQISYITKALVAVLQLGVTTDFSIFLYHSYEGKKKKGMEKEKAMSEAISETFLSVTGSSLTTIAGFLVLCTMQLTLGKDLGIVMAKGVFLGVVCVLTLFPSLLLIFDNIIEKTKHKTIIPNFTKLNLFVIKHRMVLFITFFILLIPTYLGYSHVDVYYKIDESLPKTLDSIVANKELKDKFNLVSPEIILTSKDKKAEQVEEMVKKIENIEGIDFVLSFSNLEKIGISKEMLSKDVLKIIESDNYQLLFLNSIYDIATNELNDQIVKVNTILKQYDEKAILAGEGPLMRDLVTISDIDFKNVNEASILCILVIMLVILRSLSLPLFLIISIEFAIFTNMSFSYFGGITLPFVAPIVLGTIQLGATIDYAILMTTTYIKKRKEGIEKEKAMLETTNYSAPSILVSGMCFFAATFGVGLYSKLEMVGSLCTLISRGAIISMLTVITVLPSILLIFDSIIRKTTYGMKGERKMSKKIKNVVGLIMIFGITFTVPVSALTKEETVYTKLESNGNVKSILVNEHLINKEGFETIQDISNLENILNVNSDHTFTKEKEKLNWNALGKDIFYQGTTKKQLPVELEIEYKLDDKIMNVEEMIGKSGKVTILLKYTNRDKQEVIIDGKKEILYTPFVVLTETIISGENNTNVSIKNGKIINNGNNYMVTGLAAPGLYESLEMETLKDVDEIMITYDTKKFELSSIYSIITPKLLESEDIKSLNKIDQLVSAIKTLQKAINEIEQGANELSEGSSKVENGAFKISENLEIVVTKLEELTKGASKVDEGLKQILKELESTSESLKQVTNSQDLSKISDLINTNEKMKQNLIGKNEGLKTTYENNYLKDTILEDLKKNNMDLYNVKVTYEENEKMIALLTQNIEALKTTLNLTEQTKGKITSLLATLNTYLQTMEEGSKKMSDGLVLLKDGVKELNSKMQELTLGTSSLKEGMYQLTLGITSFNQDGITKFSNIINSEVKILAKKVEMLTKIGEDYQTFTMKENETIGDTKFIMVIDSIKVPKEEKRVILKKEDSNLWTRIKSLFN